MIRVNLLGVSKEALREMAAPQVAIADKVAGLEKFRTPIIAAIAVAGLGYVGLMLYKHGGEITRLNGEISREQERKRHFEEVKKKEEDFNKKKAELENKINVITLLKCKQESPVYIMDEVSTRLDEHVWLSDMKITNNALELKATAYTLTAMTNFMANMTVSPFFKSVTLKKASEQKGMYNFDMVCEIKAKRPPNAPDSDCAKAETDKAKAEAAAKAAAAETKNKAAAEAKAKAASKALDDAEAAKGGKK